MSWIIIKNVFQSLGAEGEFFIQGYLPLKIEEGMCAGKNNLVANHGVGSLNIAFCKGGLFIFRQLKINIAIAMHHHDDFINPGLAAVADNDF